MRPLQRVELSTAIADDLAERLPWHDCEFYLRQHAADVIIHGHDEYQDLKAYVKSVLRLLRSEQIIAIADELSIPLPTHARSGAAPPGCWPDPAAVRVFISHVSPHKALAMKLKGALLPLRLHGFVAHEDIHPTAEWKLEIERALSSMDVFISMHTPGFSKSVWTQQEIGFAVCRGVPMIALRMREDPVGLIDRHQALLHSDRPADIIANEINAILMKEPRVSEKLKAAVPQLFSSGWAADDDIPF